VIVVASDASGDTPAGLMPLKLELKIALGGIPGRLDHLAVDVVRQRLYVAQLGANSGGVGDLKEGKLLHTLHPMICLWTQSVA
jgi:hypothetical protein